MSPDPRSRLRAARAPSDAVAQLVERVDRLEQELARTREEAARANEDAAGHADHLARLTRDVVADIDSLRQGAERTDAHLLARPYMSSPESLSVRDGAGREVMGFVRGTGSDSQARYSDFEAIFRGSREEVQARQQIYVDLARGREPVLDLGCGRGELLELLGQESIVASGVDLDAGMVAEAVAVGADAHVADLFTALAERPDGSLGMVFSAQVVEHLAPPDMWRLLDECHRVVRDDGVAVIETVNVHSVRALRFFWLDTTHTIPVYPESALMMARAAGFAAAVVVFPGGTGVLADDLATCGDFAIVCAKDPATLVEAGLVG